MKSILGLRSNLFYNSLMEASVVVCLTHKPKARRGKIRFLNAVNEITRERGQGFLTNDHLQRVVRAYQAFKDELVFTTVVSIERIRAKAGNLRIPTYVGSETYILQEEAAEYLANGIPTALSAWLKSSHKVRDSLQTLLCAFAK